MAPAPGHPLVKYKIPLDTINTAFYHFELGAIFGFYSINWHQIGTRIFFNSLNYMLLRFLSIDIINLVSYNNIVKTIGLR